MDFSRNFMKSYNTSQVKQILPVSNPNNYKEQNNSGDHNNTKSFTPNTPQFIQAPHSQRLDLKLKFPDILLSSFLSVIVGKPNCGKSHLLFQLLASPDLYLKKFARVFYITPTIINGLDLKQDENWIQSLDCNWIYQKLRETEEAIKNSKTEQKMHGVLFVFDDIVKELHQVLSSNKGYGKFMNQLFMNRRHVIPDCEISFFIVTQKYNLVPKSIRTVIDSLFCFQVANNDLDDIKKELIRGDIKQIECIIQQIHNKNDRNFAYLILQPFKIFNCFERIHIYDFK